MTASLSAVGRHLLFVRETDGPNRGAWVSFISRWGGGQEGDFYCCYYVCLVMDIAYRGKPPLRKTGSCHALLTEARSKGYEVSTPRIDDLFFYLDANGHAFHVGIVTNLAPFSGIAANTSEDGLSSNGTGVYEHAIPQKKCVFVRFPV